MAGTYADVPAPKIQLDKLNVIVMGCNNTGGSQRIFSAADISELTDEDDVAVNVVSANSVAHYLNIVLPEFYDILGYVLYMGANAYGTQGVDVSTDTTNGFDGTWTAAQTSANQTLRDAESVSHARLRVINTSGITANGIKGIRFKQTGNNAIHTVRLLHLFGSPTATSITNNPHRLRIWHPTNDAPVTGSHFDLGDIKPGATATKTFRVRNNSATQTANTIGLAREVLTDVSPATLAEYQFSSDGITWVNTLTVGTLAPNSTSGVLYVRRVVSTSANISPVQARILVTASSWS